MQGLRYFLTAAALLIYMHAAGQNVPRVRSLNPMCDTLTARLTERTGVKAKAPLRIEKLYKRGSRLDLQFSKTFSDYPWHAEDEKWFRGELESIWSKYVKGFRPGEISTRNNRFHELFLPHLGNDGKALPYKHSCTDPSDGKKNRFITEKGRKFYKKGLSDRYIALWQSHGRYYDDKECKWSWQRPPVHRSCEDMFTQSFVLPFLMPMLENAGAYVMSPRERDTQKLEHVVDNDNAFGGERGHLVRKEGIYSENGNWLTGGPGFADTKERYSISDLPFSSGSTRYCWCSGGKKADADVCWEPIIEESGDYAVYVSYETMESSNPAAHYRVTHSGGVTEFTVNQKIGGGTWIYLGTFHFDKGAKASVILDNSGAEEYSVSADAVRFGGGMGKIERGGSLSGLPAYAEGALYSMVYSGVDTTITHGWDKEYTNEFASRGAWTKMMMEEKGIPFDLSLAFHTDAGVTPNDSIIGTLAIYSYPWDGKKTFENGRSRMTSRLMAGFIQEQVVKDIRSSFEPEWRQREIWDRSYSESRTTGVPGMILELMSHQNFADMKYGLDPSFRFTVSRAVYKGILKTISSFYDCPYVVQPLPVHGMALEFTPEGNARLSWKETPDELEPTARASSYMIYMRMDDGVFDKGIEIRGTEIETSIEPGHIYSFKVCAMNEGGMSFPSEILSIGLSKESAGKSPVLIVNNFDRVGAPAWIDGAEYAGFEASLDSGVPYISDLSYIGENYEFRRTAEYENFENPGFGASLTDKAGGIVAGNTFDFPYVHGKALMALGHSFCSVSREAFCEKRGWNCSTADIICGKQRTSIVGSGAMPARYSVFPKELKSALKEWCGKGGNLLVSGANIGSDERGSGFTESLLGYSCLPGPGTAAGVIGDMEFYNRINSDCYCVESPDALEPASRKASVMLIYPLTNRPAAVSFKGKGYKTVSIGVPIETVKSESNRIKLLKESLQELQTN